MKKTVILLVPIILTAIACSGHAQKAAHSSLKLPAIISDNMVLQTGEQDVLWGWAPAGTAVQIDFVDGQSKTLASAQATADAGGKWSAKLPPLAAGAAGELHIAAGAEPAVIVHNVMVGETWLCGGQSNMTYAIKSANTPPEMFARAQKEATDSDGAIRYLTVEFTPADSALDNVHARWVIATPDTVARCSAVAWNFAVALREKVHFPIGLVISAVGGTAAERWIPKADIDATSVGPELQKHYKDMADHAPVLKEKYDADYAAWLKINPTHELQVANKPSRPHDPGPTPFVGDLYNGMIHGIEPYNVRGVIWFQADGNLGQYSQYGELITTLIKVWRREWHTELPFYYVEMNNMRDLPQKNPVQYHDLCLLREEQEAALELPGTDVACSIDLGLPEFEPHFPNKKPVGQRLALLAFNNIYGFPCEAHSPQYASYAVEGGKIRVQFKYADGLRVRGGGKMQGFAIRGATGDWVWADGRIEGNEALLWSD